MPRKLSLYDTTDRWTRDHMRRQAEHEAEQLRRREKHARLSLLTDAGRAAYQQRERDRMNAATRAYEEKRDARVEAKEMEYRYG